MAAANKEHGTPESLQILVIQPDPLDDLHRFRDWLESEMTELETLRPYAGDSIPSDINIDALIVLGGSMGVMDVDRFPWLADVGALMRRTVDDGIPTLGICLGAQILADALGGDVRKGKHGIEAGVVKVAWSPDSIGDHLVDGLPQPFVAGTMHSDAIVTLPEGAVHLGTGDVYSHQVYRVGSAWGVQFHPETSPELFRSWQTEALSGGMNTEIDFEDWAGALEESDADISAASEQLARRFVWIAREAQLTKIERLSVVDGLDGQSAHSRRL